jgi:hypothetical protein
VPLVATTESWWDDNSVSKTAERSASNWDDLLAARMVWMLAGELVC